MKHLLLIKEIYSEGFRDLGYWIAKYYFKVLFWVTCMLLLVVLYAFSYRLSTGFYF